MAGELVIRKGGHVGVEDSNRVSADERGRFQAFTNRPEECCCCQPCDADPGRSRTLHSWYSDAVYQPPENLEPFRHEGGCFRYWKITSGYGSDYDGGVVEDGELIGLTSPWGVGTGTYRANVSLVLLCVY